MAQPISKTKGTMNGTKLIPKPVESSILSDGKMGFGMGFKVGGFPFRIPFSDDLDLILGGELKLQIPDHFKLHHNVYLQFLHGSSEGKIMPTDDSATTDNSHWSLMLGTGRTSKFATSFSNDGELSIIGAIESKSFIGFGNMNIAKGDYSLMDETYSFNDSDEYTFDIGSEYSVGGMVSLGGDHYLGLSPSVYYGAQFAGSGSEYNRISLALMINLTYDMLATSTISGDNTETKIGTMANAMLAFGLAHGLFLRYAMNETLSDPQQYLADFDNEFGEGDTSTGPLSTAKIYQSSAALFGVLGGSIQEPLRSDLYWLYAAAKVGGGIGFLAMDSDADKSGGMGDLLYASWLLGYAIAGINTVEGRLALTDEEKEMRESYVNIGCFLLDSAFTLIGGLAESKFIAGAGASASMPVAHAPNQVTNMLSGSDIQFGISPISEKFSFTIHKDWKHLPLFSSINVLFGFEAKNTDINASMGAQYKHPNFRILGGINNNITFGNGTGAKAGLMAGLDVLPLGKGGGLMFGGRLFYTPDHPEEEVDLSLNIGYNMAF